MFYPLVYFLLSLNNSLDSIVRGFAFFFFWFFGGLRVVDGSSFNLILSLTLKTITFIQ